MPSPRAASARRLLGLAAGCKRASERGKGREHTRVRAKETSEERVFRRERVCPVVGRELVFESRAESGPLLCLG